MHFSQIEEEKHEESPEGGHNADHSMQSISQSSNTEFKVQPLTLTQDDVEPEPLTQEQIQAVIADSLGIEHALYQKDD